MEFGHPRSWSIPRNLTSSRPETQGLRVLEKEGLHGCYFGVNWVSYSRGWGLAQCLLCSAFSLFVLPASVSLPKPWWGMGMVTVVPGMRQGGARQAVNGVWAAGLRRGRRQGRAWNQMWRRRPGRPGGSHARPGAHMAGGCGRGPRSPTTPAGVARTGSGTG